MGRLNPSEGDGVSHASCGEACLQSRGAGNVDECPARSARNLAASQSETFKFKSVSASDFYEFLLILFKVED